MRQNAALRTRPTYKHGNLIYGKGGATNQWGRDDLFSSRCWENQLTVWRKIKQDPHHTPYTKVDVRWIKDVDVNGKI